MFAYITGSSFVFIELFGIPSHHFGWVFGTNAAALIASSQLNRRLLLRREVKWVLRRAFLALAFAGSLLALAGYLGWGFWGVAAPLWAYVGILGMTCPNTTAVALQGQGAQAGAASAWLGVFQFSLAAGAAWMVSWLHDGSTLAMTTVVGGCGVSSLVVYRVVDHWRPSGAISVFNPGSCGGNPNGMDDRRAGHELPLGGAHARDGGGEEVEQICERTSIPFNKSLSCGRIAVASREGSDG
jgi:hypothetical protein